MIRHLHSIADILLLFTLHIHRVYEKSR